MYHLTTNDLADLADELCGQGSGRAVIVGTSGGALASGPAPTLPRGHPDHVPAPEQDVHAPAAEAPSVVIDLGGKVIKADMDMMRHPGERKSYSLLMSCPGTVLRNGVLQLPAGAQLTITALGCRMEGVTIRGPGGCDYACVGVLGEGAVFMLDQGPGWVNGA